MSGFFRQPRQYNKTFSPTSGDQARDAGITQALQGNPEFRVQFLQHILAMPAGHVFLSEDIRTNWKGAWAKPQHWGANVNACIMNGLLEHLPEETKMKPTKSHSKKTHWIRRTHLAVLPMKPTRKKRKKTS